MDCGKSTLVGVLAHGELDNGRGRARLNLFRHVHEIQSGRTSSISQEIIGFNSEGHVSTTRTVRGAPSLGIPPSLGITSLAQLGCHGDRYLLILGTSTTVLVMLSSQCESEFPINSSLLSLHSETLNPFHWSHLAILANEPLNPGACWRDRS